MDIENSIRQTVSRALVDYRTRHHVTQDDVADILYDYGVSLSVYRRAERGSANVSFSKLILVLEALNIKTDIFSDSAITLARTENMDHIDYYQELKKYLYTHNSSDLDIIYRKLLFRFVLYLPIMPDYILKDLLYRVSGSIIDNEKYFFTQVIHAIESVPDTAGKRYADKIAERISLLSLDDPMSFYKAKDAFYTTDIESAKSGTWAAEYADYCHAIRAKYEDKE